MNHQAIYALYPAVVTVDDTAGATDGNGNAVVIDQALVDAWINPMAYQQLRAIEYAKRNQFEMQYDDQVNGTTTWVDWQDGIKAAIPKPPITT